MLYRLKSRRRKAVIYVRVPDFLRNCAQKQVLDWIKENHSKARIRYILNFISKN
jgi:hypothetical protein